MSANKKKKHTSSPKRPSPQGATDTAEALHLDETIESIAGKTRSGLHRHWKTAVGVLVAIIVVLAGNQLLEQAAEGREASFHQRLHDLTHSDAPPPASFGAPPPAPEMPDLDGFAALTEDVEGSVPERVILQRSVAFLLARADAFEQHAAREAESAAADDSDDAPSAGALLGPSPDQRKILETARTIVEAAKQRFPQDAEVAKWAREVEGKISAELDTSWLPAPREDDEDDDDAAGEESTSADDAGDADSADTPAEDDESGS